MATFAFTARDGAGQSVSGTVTAANTAEVVAALRAEGKYPISIRPAAAGEENAVAAHAGIKISRVEVIQISTQLAVMVETGVTLADALDCIAKQAVKPNMQAILNDLTEQLQAGIAFSDALARHPRSFPRLYISLIRASEKTGMLAKLLNRATAYMRDEQEIMRKVKGALTYPGIMFGFAFTTTIFLLAFVLPRFTTIYANKKAALPAPTKFLMDVSDLIINQWPALIGGALVLGAASFWYFRTPAGLRVWHSIQLSAPLLGKLYRKVHLARGLRMIGTMSAAGVNLLDCVNTAYDLCPNSQFRDLWRSASDQIQSGKQFSDPLFRSDLVPRSVAQMIFSGEKSGKLAFVMEQVAGYSEDELKEQIAALTRYIEPLMIVLMGLIIGGISLALLLPVFTIGKVMSAH